MSVSGSSGVTQVSGEVNAIPFQADLKGDTTTGTTSAARTDTYVVPVGKYWILKHANTDRQQAGVNVFNVDIDGTRYQLFKAPSQTVTNFNNINIKLKAGDQVAMYSGAGSSGVVATYLTYEEYDI